MQQQVAVITLGIADIERSRRFYVEGFGWTPVFENEEIVFYQMNGFVFGTWLRSALEEDMRRSADGSGAFALAHNVGCREEVQPLLDQDLVLGRDQGQYVFPVERLVGDGLVDEAQGGFGGAGFGDLTPHDLPLLG